MNSIPSKSDVGELLDRYLIGLDDEMIDDSWARLLFTDDVRVEFPMSTHEGLEGAADYHRRSLAAFQSTQHLNSPAVVDFTDESTAVFRANLVSTHVHLPGRSKEPLFTAGTLVNGSARLTPDGWRIAALALRVVWTDGQPPDQEVA